MKQLRLVLAASIIVFGFSACEKENLPVALDEATLSLQETQAEEVTSDIDILVDEAIDQNSSQLKSAYLAGAYYLTDCPIITINKNATPQVITIDFGTSCTGKDGKVRSGKIIITSASFTTFPSVRDKSFENYTVDGKKIEGSITKTISRDQVNNIRTAVISENITITFPDGEGSAKRVANLTRQYQRNVLLNKNDNQIVSWGTVEFTRISGVVVTKTIPSDDPLVFKMECHHIVSGTVSVVTSNNRSWTIDYGDGDCDNLATLTIGEKTKEIKIR